MKTDIYYSAEWLVEGGPPFESQCPPVPEHHESEELPIKVSATLRQHSKSGLTYIQFFVHVQGRVLMETDDPDAVGEYIKAYANGVNGWAKALNS